MKQAVVYTHFSYFKRIQKNTNPDPLQRDRYFLYLLNMSKQILEYLNQDYLLLVKNGRKVKELDFEALSKNYYASKAGTKTTEIVFRKRVNDAKKLIAEVRDNIETLFKKTFPDKPLPEITNIDIGNLAILTFLEIGEAMEAGNVFLKKNGTTKRIEF